MTTDNHQAAQAFFETHKKLRELAAELAPYEERYLSMDGLGSAGMEVDGVYDYYIKKSEERGELVAELKRLRTEVGDEGILSELQGVEGSEAAKEYIRKVPLKEFQPEARKETKRGFFGRFR